MIHSILNWKKCKKCWKSFDIAINYDICPVCRKKRRRTKNESK